MNEKNIQPRHLALVAMILIAALLRLAPSSNLFGFMSNFTPIGAMALFGGCYFRNKLQAFAIPLFALFISDVLINRLLYFDHWVFFYEGAAWTYGVFAVTVLLGTRIQAVKAGPVTAAAIGAATLHWLVTDFGVWLFPAQNPVITPALSYSADWQGLLQCYAMGFPFFINMVIGNLVYCLVLFGGFEWMQRRYPALQLQPA